MAVSIATIIGQPRIGMSRLRFRLKSFMEAFLLFVPWWFPVIIISLGLYYFFAPMSL